MQENFVLPAARARASQALLEARFNWRLLLALLANAALWVGLAVALAKLR